MFLDLSRMTRSRFLSQYDNITVGEVRKLFPQILNLSVSFKNDQASSEPETIQIDDIDPFPKRQRVVYNCGFPEFKALYCSVKMVSSIEIS